ncbi:hypothetical protein AQUCO_04900190v1, partial [Aquilegia coerulea]
VIVRKMSLVSLSRITIRPFKPSDLDDIMVWGTDDRVMRFILQNKFTTREDAMSFLEIAALPYPWRRSICLDDRSIGLITFIPGSGEYICRGDVGCALAVQYWSQGIATEAIKLGIACVFQEFPHIERLQALVEVENKASQRIVEKVGFLKEGLLRKCIVIKANTKDMICYSLLTTGLLSLNLQRNKL